MKKAITRRPKMADVARMAGVSITTVSRSYNEPDAVSEKIRLRIAEAARSLSYIPNVMAGSLAATRSKTVAVVVPTLNNSVFALTLEEMTGVLNRRGYQVMVSSSDYVLEREEELVKSLLSWSPAGIVLVGRHHTRGTLRLLVEDGLPVVEVGEYLEGAIDSNIGFSHREVGRRIGRHFADLGIRRLGLALVALPGDHRAADRAAGFREVVHEAGLHLEEFVLSERASSKGGATAFADLMGRPDRPQAIFFSNDMLCLGALFEAGRLGIRVPDDVKLCGYGDFDFAATSSPSLSSVRPPDREIGRQAGELLLERFRGEGAPLSINLGFEHIVRASG
ncbi:LacI family DNA-binding transcriptional regulator [Rhizobium sp. LCM 4573]|uniref:LacI family DNA-binding transcriptional regulator n=1 Tax=Rhizobium sp. LCM 4573 TaxID=1848291 RepID=UPI001FCD3C60|nr:LacI family DNA-binding transcriptional regulator [Rhizobium sp. LCM 4573]